MATGKIKRLLNSLTLMTSSGNLGVKYSRTQETRNNWGDALNAYIIPALSGKKVMHYSEYFNTGLTKTLGGIGSILDNNVTKNLYVWGSGLKSSKSPIPVLPKEVFAVRGHLTKARLKELGVNCPDVFGDPAVILPRFYMPMNKTKKYKLGIVPHYVDKASDRLKPFVNDPDIAILDIEDPIETFVDKLYACEVIASSSLHGLIAADAYTIPRVWLKLSDNISGGDYKFQDYFSTTDIPGSKGMLLDGATTKQSLVSKAEQPSKIADVDKLISSFPFPL